MIRLVARATEPHINMSVGNRNSKSPGTTIVQETVRRFRENGTPMMIQLRHKSRRNLSAMQRLDETPAQ